jgi:hypothetical protein
MIPSTTTLKSWFDTFSAMFLTSIAVNIDQLDLQNLSKGALLAFAITIIRDLIKRLSQKYLDRKILANNR